MASKPSDTIFPGAELNCIRFNFTFSHLMYVMEITQFRRRASQDKNVTDFRKMVETGVDLRLQFKTLSWTLCSKLLRLTFKL